MDFFGNFLFRYRGFIPLPLYLLTVYAASRLPAPDAVLPRVLYWEGFCFLVAALGQFIRIVVAGYVADGTSGRNTGGQVANDLNTTGLYSIVRHPLYGANFILGLAVVMLARE